MPISFVRIDDRIIHGQVVTRWAKFKPCNGILVVDEKAANDPLQKRILEHAAPPGVKVGVYTVLEGVEKVNKARNAKNSYFVIVNSPITLEKLVESGADFGKDLNVGPMSSRTSTKQIAKNVSITVEEEAAFDYLHKHGIEITFQLIPDESATTWAKLKGGR
ncbi:PTS sugar transporter subunit IIB [Listeria booriae]|uniref:PTS sugar transporter subunit IIB n=1 Tax=Listeria booriae TaxID=1552123 RepID=A0A7X0XDW3_9LIST|nr:PTS sugar transporter subunit IIB [Listeria booriae]MBC1492426.1 PTS sugar transporter subunit IIB [Listeria booriae]MBC1504069.1 PTS sugar transporter subunit IIB [Listeria booriae]MBC1524280.1 PTS sugar transporter subunit IIB [Listeria booriae]MBC1531097.1 PTS sugar transporter subunit IIB [Listeria booriae]MBC6135239.1 PTS sugar transporter subunit IIB [Listeria booriae]